MSEMVEKKAEQTFHGVFPLNNSFLITPTQIEYLITVNADPNTLHITIEQKLDGERWKNSFPSKYIEEITQKTGNHKKFPVFVRMLLKSLDNSSESVFLDVLTFFLLNKVFMSDFVQISGFEDVEAEEVPEESIES